MKNAGIVQRARHSLAGLVLAWKTERSLRFHGLVSLLFAALLAWRGVALHWWALAVLALGLGWALEIANAAIEALCDKLHPQRDPAIGAVKDLASAGAFTANMAALTVALLALAAGR